MSKNLIFSALVLLFASSCGGGGGSSSSNIDSNPKCGSIESPLRIMPLGDSITSGQPGYTSYRFPLWNNLKGAGCLIDFVGSKTGVSEGKKDGEDVLLDLDFDQDHEGYWNYRSDEILPLIPNLINNANPEIVLIHLGSNDLIQGEGVANAATDVEAIVNAVQEAKPGVVIYLAKLIPIANRDGLIQELNAQIEPIASRLNSEGSPVIVVDMYTDFSKTDDLKDGIHPDSSGEQKIADRFTNAILADFAG